MLVLVISSDFMLKKKTVHESITNSFHFPNKKHGPLDVSMPMEAWTMVPTSRTKFSAQQADAFNGDLKRSFYVNYKPSGGFLILLLDQ